VPAPDHSGDGYARVLVLGKALDILDLFTLEQPELSLRDIRERSGLPVSTCARLVHNLVVHGVLSEHGGRYRIGLTVLRWSAVARQGLDVVEIVAPLLARLRDASGETAGLFVLDRDRRVCVALAESRQAVGRRLTLGHTLPAHVGSPGKVLLAFDDTARARILAAPLEPPPGGRAANPAKLAKELDAIREQGFATSFGEWQAEVAGVAAPVFAADGELAGAIAVSAPRERLGPEVLEERIAAVRAVAAEASAQLGYQPVANPS
jgi:IclR family transcriptional regulator, acetate operon repressor